MSDKLNREEILELMKNAKDSEDFKKIKRIAGHSSVKLGDLRKKFCRACFHPLKGNVRIKNKMKIIECENCHEVSRWKIGTSEE